LLAVLEKPGEVVTREELRAKLWPADTFVDFDHGLNAAVRRLRDTLGDTAENPRYIETLPRRGYRFIGPLDGCCVSGGIGIAAPPERIKPSWLRLCGLAVISAIVIGVLVWAPWKLSLRRAEIIERKLTLNSAESGVSGAALSPDRQYLAYSDHTGIYLKMIRSGETHQVQLPPGFSARVDDWFP